MKKPLLVVASAAVAAVLVAPKIIGNDASQRLDEIVAEVNNLPGYEITVLETEKNWFSSSSTVKLAFDPFALDPSVASTPEVEEMLSLLQLEMKIDMQHGPVLLNKGLGLSDIQIRIPNTFDKIKHNNEIVENLYVYDGKVSLLGDMVYSDSFSPMQVIFDSGAIFEFTGYKGSGVTNNGKMDYIGEAKTAEVNSPQMNFTLSDMKINWNGDYEFSKIIKGIYGDMQSSFVVGDFQAKAASQPLFGGQGLAFYFNSLEQDNELIDMQFGYLIEALDTPIDKFEDIEIKFEFNNLSQRFMQEYQQLMVAVQDPQLDQEKLLADLKPAMIDILSYKPFFQMSNMGFKTVAGVATSHADVKLANYEVDEDKLVDITYWQNNLLVDSAVALPKSLATDLVEKTVMMQLNSNPDAAQYTPEKKKELAAQQAKMMVDSFLQSGYIVEENEQLQLNFAVKDGVANLNGQEFPLSAIMPATEQ